MSTEAVHRDSIVTGGGSGIARSICLRLADSGLVGVLDRDPAGAQETVELIEARGGRAVALVADVSDVAAVDGAFANFERLGGVPEVVVACAGVERVGDIIDEPEADWDLVMAVNAKGVYSTARAAMARFTQRRRGSFVVISSDAGVTGANGFAIYCASKFAAVGLVKCLALDYGHLGIRSNVVCPATVRTPMLAEYLIEHPNAEEYWASSVPLGRLAEPEEVADAVVFLASPDASYMNGSVYLIDGGATAGSWPPIYEA
jgi:NAD(P)-dependent dehydrogenase (short-subunit alcohol dehydrogenase family)